MEPNWGLLAVTTHEKRYRSSVAAKQSFRQIAGHLEHAFAGLFVFGDSTFFQPERSLYSPLP